MPSAQPPADNLHLLGSKTTCSRKYAGSRSNSRSCIAVRSAQTRSYNVDTCHALVQRHTRCVAGEGGGGDATRCSRGGLVLSSSREAIGMPHSEQITKKGAIYLLPTYKLDVAGFCRRGRSPSRSLRYCTPLPLDRNATNARGETLLPERKYSQGCVLVRHHSDSLLSSVMLRCKRFPPRAGGAELCQQQTRARGSML